MTLEAIHKGWAQLHRCMGRLRKAIAIEQEISQKETMHWNTVVRHMQNNKSFKKSHQ